LDHYIETLRAWARGDLYPLKAEELGRNALDDLSDEMKRGPRDWWAAYQELLPELDRDGIQKLGMPFAALLDAGGEALRDEVFKAALRDPGQRNPYWDATEDLGRADEAYRRFGRRATVEAFARHQARIPLGGQPWPNEGDEWSGEAVIYLVDKEPEEAWAFALELLHADVDPYTVGAFVIEDLLRDHGDHFIERIEVEAARNERFRQALPITEWAIPPHLFDRVKAAAGPAWQRRASG